MFYLKKPWTVMTNTQRIIFGVIITLTVLIFAISSSVASKSFSGVQTHYEQVNKQISQTHHETQR